MPGRRHCAAPAHGVLRESRCYNRGHTPRRGRGAETMIRSVLCCAVAALSFVAGACASQAQSYPARPVTIVVPLAAGSGMDTLVRAYAEKLTDALGKPVVIENKPGAALMLAAQNVAAAPADGHTLLVSTSTAMAINP